MDKIFNIAHPVSEPPPPVDGEDYTDDVQIDIDGERKIFTIGHYDYTEKQWYSHCIDHVIERTGMWQYLPLAKYDKGS